MGLFREATEMQLEAAELELLGRTLEGDGGHQRLLRDIINRLGKHGELRLEDEELQKVARYAYRYGGGGYQDRFKAVLAAARRAGWRQS